jgi:hypothetical protein
MQRRAKDEGKTPKALDSRTLSLPGYEVPAIINEWIMRSQLMDSVEPDDLNTLIQSYQKINQHVNPSELAQFILSDTFHKVVKYQVITSVILLYNL